MSTNQPEPSQTAIKPVVKLSVTSDPDTEALDHIAASYGPPTTYSKPPDDPSRSSQTPTTLPPWPPHFTSSELQHLTSHALTFAILRGYALRPPNPSGPPNAAAPAPLTLCPTPFPRRLYQLARDLSPLYNALYARVAMDWDVLDEVMRDVVTVDPFQEKLWQSWKHVREDAKRIQPLTLGVFRSDYMLHDRSAEGKPFQIKQVEFNTIAASFGALADRSAKMHRYLHATSRSYWNRDPWLADQERIPVNESVSQIVYGMAKAIVMYEATRPTQSDVNGAGDRAKAVVLFVVQENERNLFDQQILQAELLEAYGVLSIRRTFSELQAQVQLPNPDDLTLYIPDSASPNSPPHEIGLVYYRAGYGPSEYHSDADWETRSTLERSAAIKCPSMALQLAGAKKMQQVLAEPGQLEYFLLGEHQPDVGFGKGAGNLTPAHLAMMRQTWVGLYPMDDSPGGETALAAAMSHPEKYVLKPQREGGGNNIYRHNIPPFLEQLEKEDKESQKSTKARYGYILMDMINVPKGIRNLLVRSGDSVPRLVSTVSELGVYGICVFGGDLVAEVMNRVGGTLLRTKSDDSDEGGVAIGISSVDTPLLVD